MTHKNFRTVSNFILTFLPNQKCEAHIFFLPLENNGAIIELPESIGEKSEDAISSAEECSIITWEGKSPEKTQAAIETTKFIVGTLQNAEVDAGTCTQVRDKILALCPELELSDSISQLIPTSEYDKRYFLGQQLELDDSNRFLIYFDPEIDGETARDIVQKCDGMRLHNNMVVTFKRDRDFEHLRHETQSEFPGV